MVFSNKFHVGVVVALQSLTLLDPGLVWCWRLFSSGTVLLWRLGKLGTSHFPRYFFAQARARLIVIYFFCFGAPIFTIESRGWWGAAAADDDDDDDDYHHHHHHHHHHHQHHYISLLQVSIVPKFLLFSHSCFSRYFFRWNKVPWSQDKADGDRSGRSRRISQLPNLPHAQAQDRNSKASKAWIDHQSIQK